MSPRLELSVLNGDVPLPKIMTHHRELYIRSNRSGRQQTSANNRSKLKLKAYYHFEMKLRYIQARFMP